MQERRKACHLTFEEVLNLYFEIILIIKYFYRLRNILKFATYVRRFAIHLDRPLFSCMVFAK